MHQTWYLQACDGVRSRLVALRSALSVPQVKGGLFVRAWAICAHLRVICHALKRLSMTDAHAVLYVFRERWPRA
eukprot:3725061-Pleurochrysis_carterae.AAC.9